MESEPKRSGDEEFTLVYPKHKFSPKDLLLFVEMKGFSADLEDLSLTVEDLSVCQLIIMTDPPGCGEIPDTGGLRYVAMSRRKAPKGQPKTVYVYYAYFEEYGVALLVFASSAPIEFSNEQREAIALTLAEQSVQFSNGPVRFKNNP